MEQEQWDIHNGDHLELHPADDPNGLTVLADIDPDGQLNEGERLRVAGIMAAAPSMLFGYRRILSALGTSPMDDTELADLCREMIDLTQKEY